MNRAIVIRRGVVLMAVLLAGGLTAEVRDLGGGARVEVLSRAEPDEYFYAVGDPSNRFVYGGIDPDACATNGARPKINQAYVWGMGLSGSNIFFGTMANTDSLVLSGYLRQTNPSLTYYKVAEYGEGVFGRALGLPAMAGDWRPPRLFRYNRADGTLTDLAAALPPADRARLQAVLGIRAGGALPPSPRNPAGLAILAGPMLEAERGCAFFLFDGSGAFLGSCEIPRYTNIRRFIEVNGDLYAPVQLTNGTGQVIRWIGNPARKGYPFKRIEVGALDQSGADICRHEGRLFVTTWPGLLEQAQRPGSGITPEELFLKAVGLWMSPVVPDTGLPAGSAWTKVWNINEYEPNPIAALAYGGGALASFDGWLYFGTLNVPLLGTYVHAIASGDYEALLDGTLDLEDYVRDVFPKTHRATSVFRGRDFRAPVVLAGTTIRTGGEFQVLYGYTNLWVYDLEDKTWSLEPNKMEPPRMGGPGVNNDNNAYTWVMEVLDHNLYVGTFDFSFPGSTGSCARAVTNPATRYGGDLYRLPSSRARTFEAVSLNGMGNIANYGLRTMATDGRVLYIGTANPRNLLADFEDELPDGGWELLAFTQRPGTPFDRDGDFAADFAAVKADGRLALLSLYTDVWTDGAFPAGGLAAFADYDRDRRCDPAAFVPGSAAWTLWLSSRGGARQKPVVTAPGAGGIPVPADYDRDGKIDFGVWNPADSTLAWRSSKNGRWVTAAPPLVPALPAPGGYGPRGKIEPAWYLPASGRWSRRLKAGQPPTLFVLKPRVRGGVPCPADFDGDGRTDYAVHDPASGLLHVWSAVTLEHQSFGPRPWPWVAACADYDGDGKADAAWYNPKTALLDVRFSASASSAVYAYGHSAGPGAWPVMSPARLLYKAVR